MFESLVKFRDLVNQDSLFWFCALLGSGMYFLQFLLSLFGNADLEGTEVDALQVKWL
jgi:hypothetical protein